MSIVREIAKLSPKLSTLRRPTVYNFNFRDFKNVDEAVTLFNEMLQMDPNLPSPPGYGHLLSIIKEMGNYSQVIVLFKKLCFLGWPVNGITRHRVVQSYCNLKESELGFASLATFQKRGYAPNAISIGLLIEGFFLEGNVAKSLELCKKFITPSLFETLELTSVTLGLSAMCKRLNLVNAVKLIEVLLEENYDCVGFYYKVIDRLCENKMLDDAINIFSKMIGSVFFPHQTGILPYAVTCNTLINGLCDMKRWDEANTLLRKIVDVDCLQGKSYRVKKLLDIMVERGLDPNLVHMIKDYCKHKKTDTSWEMFNKMPPKRDNKLLISWLRTNPLGRSYSTNVGLSLIYSNCRPMEEN